MSASDSKPMPQDTKKLFRKLGTCSRTVFYILNRHFDHNVGLEERASDPLAGGMLRQGYQCGMLWGASLAAGAEAYRRLGNRDQAIGMTIRASQHITQSFMSRAKSLDCCDVTECDWNSKLSMVKYFITARFLNCFRLMEQWAPEAIQLVDLRLSEAPADLPSQPTSCASEVVLRMGASDQQAVMVAGFAGGIGLTGNACGALGAAIWMRTLDWCRENPGKSGYNNPRASDVLEAFYRMTDHSILCSEITGRTFSSAADHTEFIRSGGCAKLIDALARG